MRCRERTGFLFAHRCDHPVVAQCARCNKPICTHHRRIWQGQELCISCYKQQAQPPQDQAAATYDRGYYAYYDDPFWYSYYHYRHYSYYDDRDHAVFDQGDAAQDFSSESDWEAS